MKNFKKLKPLEREFKICFIFNHLNNQEILEVLSKTYNIELLQESEYHIKRNIDWPSNYSGPVYNMTFINKNKNNDYDYFNDIKISTFAYSYIQSPHTEVDPETVDLRLSITISNEKKDINDLDLSEIMKNKLENNLLSYTDFIRLI
jgi:hypothetical protein